MSRRDSLILNEVEIKLLNNDLVQVLEQNSAKFSKIIATKDNSKYYIM